MKIVHIITTLGDGGAERTLFNICKNNKRKHNQVVVSLLDHGKYGKLLNKLGIPLLLDLPDGNLGNEANHTSVIKNSIQKVNPDLIVTHYYKDYHSDHINLSKIVKRSAGHYIPILYCDTMMGINFLPNYYVDVTKFMNDKINSISCHKTQKPERFINLVKLMNEYRSAQCNAPKGNYAEAFFFEPSFPFSDIRNILPKSPTILPFHIENINGFL